MQGCLGPGAEGQHLQAGVEAPQLLLQAGRGEAVRAAGTRAAQGGPGGLPRGTACLGGAVYLGDSELLGMKAKSRRGKKSLGPIMPKPLVRLGCILQNRALSCCGFGMGQCQLQSPGPLAAGGHRGALTSGAGPGRKRRTARGT